jgi:8-oxo-dGTP pyrophosphatase MutT (NUDIX family)
MGITDPAEALGLVAAAIRETFEETGILLAREHGAAACAVRESGEARAALLEGRATLREVAAGEGVHLATAELLYLAHWITPEPEPRRYDTRFFLARVPEDAECTPHRAELVDAAWMRPAEAVGRFAAGEMKMLPPTVHTLAQLAPFASVDEAWAARVDAPVQAILPRMERHPDGVLIRVPRME